MFSIKCSYSGKTPSNIIDFAGFPTVAAAVIKLTKMNMTLDMVLSKLTIKIICYVPLSTKIDNMGSKSKSFYLI